MVFFGTRFFFFLFRPSDSGGLFFFWSSDVVTPFFFFLLSTSKHSLPLLWLVKVIDLKTSLFFPFPVIFDRLSPHICEPYFADSGQS